MLLLSRKGTLVQTDSILRPTEDNKSFKKEKKKKFIHASKHLVINTDGEEETGKSRMGRSHWDIAANVNPKLTRLL